MSRKNKQKIKEPIKSHLPLEFQNEGELWNYFKDKWNHVNPWGAIKKTGQLKDPSEVARIKKNIALALLLPDLGQRPRMRSMLDLYPQQLTITITQDSLNTFKEIQVPVPINRLSVNREKAWVIEITRVQRAVGLGVFSLAATGNEVSDLQLATTEIGSIDYTDTTVFYMDRVGVRVLDDNSNEGSIATAVFNPETIMYDMTTEGKGFLVGTDSIFAGFITSSASAVATAVMKVWYKFTEVGLAEYIGMIQGQMD